MGMTEEVTGTIVRPGDGAVTRLRDIEARFKVIAGEDDSIDVDELQAGLRLNDADYARRIFNLIDQDSGGTISLWEFIQFARVLVEGAPDEKLRIIFDLHDLNGDGTVDLEELTHILDRSLNEHSLDISDEKLAALSKALFDKVDTDKSGSISFSEFKVCIDGYPGLKAQMVASSASWLQLPSRIASERRRPGRSLRAMLGDLARMWSDQRPWIILLLLFAAGNVWFFREGMLAEARNGSDMFTQIGQAAAYCLKFNGAVILFGMLRHILTFLRRTPVGSYLPLDHAIDFHKIVGHTFFALALVHVAGYIGAYESFIDPDFFTREVVYGELLKSRIGWSGLSLLVVFVVIWFFALGFIRRKGLFEAFYFSHQLFWAFFALMLVHFPDIWKWIVAAGVLYLGERVVRLLHGNRPAEMDDLAAMPSNVTRIRMRRPDWFHYHPGEYVFVRHPAISRREWHPFTITSNPEDAEALELHVRSIGTWTRALNDLARQPVSERASNWPRVYLDGPYGSPASDIFDSTVPVLIGAGIGVTPFASILRSILHRRRAQDPAIQSMQRVYFIWMNRDQSAFEWFLSLMSELESDPATRDLIDIRVYLTGLKAEITSASLTVAMEVYHEALQQDLLTGLRSQTQLSRPDWQAVFGGIREAHPDQQVDVFFCGPDGLSRELVKQSGRFGFGYKKENF